MGHFNEAGEYDLSDENIEEATTKNSATNSLEKTVDSAEHKEVKQIHTFPGYIADIIRFIQDARNLNIDLLEDVVKNLNERLKFYILKDFVDPRTVNPNQRNIINYRKLKRLKADYTITDNDGPVGYVNPYKGYKKYHLRIKQATRNVVIPFIDGCENIKQHLRWDQERQLRMFYEKTLETLREYGITQMDCLSRQFNPDYYEALKRIVAPNFEDNTIIKVSLKGYTYQPRPDLKPTIIRTAKVWVSSKD